MTNSSQILPLSRNPDVVTFTIKMDGEEISGVYHVLSLMVKKEINRIASAQLILKDGDPAEGNFEASSSDLFIPGKAIEIKAGYHADETTIFKGIVVKHNLRTRKGNARLYLECRDEAFKMTIGKKNRYFEEVSDADAIETIIDEFGLNKEVEATEVQHQELVQFDSSDWDFILSRADVNGRLCTVDDGKITIQKPDLSQEPELTLQYGATILELDTEMDARFQYDGVKARSWDLSGQELLEIDGQDPGFEETGNLSGGDLSEQLEQTVFEMHHSGNVKSEELQAWADAKFARSRLSKIRGRIKIDGYPDIKPAQMIKLEGMGDRFNGKIFVSGVLHKINDGQWTSDLQLGLKEEWFVDQFRLPSASALLPAVKGLQIGVVTDLEADPEGEDRIKVRLPIIDPNGEGIWSRLACLDAGNERGAFFRPEIGDEAIVGFINDDPRDAVTLGMLHSSAKPSPEPISNDNHKKGYISREKLKLEFDDEKKIITIETPGGNSMILDDDAGGITLQDQNGNKIIMDSNGISIESASALNVKANQDGTIEALNLTASAQVALKVEGSASAEISSGGNTVVKGSIVQIN